MTFDAVEDQFGRWRCRINSHVFDSHDTVDGAVAHLSALAADDPPSQVWVLPRSAGPWCAATFESVPTVRVTEDRDGTWWCRLAGSSAVHEPDLPSAVVRAEQMAAAGYQIWAYPNRSNPRQVSHASTDDY